MVIQKGLGVAKTGKKGSVGGRGYRKGLERQNGTFLPVSMGKKIHCCGVFGVGFRGVSILQDLPQDLTSKRKKRIFGN